MKQDLDNTMSYMTIDPLLDQAKSELRNKEIIHCPKCRASIPDIKMLEDSSELITIKCPICEKEETVKIIDLVKGNTEYTKIKKNNCFNVEDHGIKPSAKYCIDCEKFLCISCITGGLHKNLKHKQIDCSIPFQKTCKKHKLPLTHYCTENDEHICFRCLDSNKHSKHSNDAHISMVSLINEKYKEKFDNLNQTIKGLEEYVYQDFPHYSDIISKEVEEKMKDIEEISPDENPYQQKYEEKLKQFGQNLDVEKRELKEKYENLKKDLQKEYEEKIKNYESAEEIKNSKNMSSDEEKKYQEELDEKLKELDQNFNKEKKELKNDYKNFKEILQSYYEEKMKNYATEKIPRLRGIIDALKANNESNSYTFEFFKILVNNYDQLQGIYNYHCINNIIQNIIKRGIKFEKNNEKLDDDKLLKELNELKNCQKEIEILKLIRKNVRNY